MNDIDLLTAKFVRGILTNHQTKIKDCIVLKYHKFLKNIENLNVVSRCCISNKISLN